MVTKSSLGGTQFYHVISLCLALLLQACSSSTEIIAADGGVEVPTQQDVRTPLEGDWSLGGMVAAANPHAVAAAREMLARGGHAVDAVIAAHAVLGLVEPESSGIGGSAFMLVYEFEASSLALYDGRETAPAKAFPGMFRKDGRTMTPRDAWQTGLGVGVPGTVALYEKAHAVHGKLPWADLLQPAIKLAKEGFEVSPKLSNWLVELAPLFDADAAPASARYFYPGGDPLPVGYLRKNRQYAKTLSRIAAKGSAAFYSGSIARAIARRAQKRPLAGSLSTEDLSRYQAVLREPVCGGFREMRICSAPPPSSGIAQIMIAGLYDRMLDGVQTDSLADKLQIFVDAQRLAYADRDHYIADPEFVPVPVADLIDARYLEHRAAQRFTPSAQPTHGDPAAVPGGVAALAPFGSDTTREMAGTTHLSIIDLYGNAVSMTASVGAPFGSFRWTNGFLLNNELTDFSMAPEVDGKVAANVVEPGKRPRSSQSPTMIFDQQDRLRMVTGSPGGNSIVAFVAKTVLGGLDWGLSAQEAADFPNIIARGDIVRVESTEAAGKAIAADLQRRGYKVLATEGENSGIHLIMVHPDRLEGAADSRREGMVVSVPRPDSLIP